MKVETLKTMYRSDYDYLTKLFFFAGKLMWNHWWKR